MSQTASQVSYRLPRSNGASSGEVVHTGSARPSLSEAIAKRAYEMFVERGCVHGFHEQDWLTAEAELKGVRT